MISSKIKFLTLIVYIGVCRCMYNQSTFAPSFHHAERRNGKRLEDKIIQNQQELHLLATQLHLPDTNAMRSVSVALPSIVIYNNAVILIIGK